MGVGPLSHLEIEAWGRLMGIDPPIGPSETESLRNLDIEFRNYNSEKDKPQAKSIVRELHARKLAHDREQKKLK